jgi:hypothetical protein
MQVLKFQWTLDKAVTRRLAVPSGLSIFATNQEMRPTA